MAAKIDARETHYKNGERVDRTRRPHAEPKVPGAFGAPQTEPPPEEVIEKAVKRAKTVETPKIVIPKPRIATLRVNVRGVRGSPLVVHNWTHKAVQQMRDKQMGKARGPKEDKVPEDDFRESMYRLPDGGHGVPATAFKAAMVDACRFTEGLTMTLAKLLFFVEADGVSTKRGVGLVRVFNPDAVAERAGAGRPKTGRGEFELCGQNGGKVEWPRMREDLPRLANGNPDLRYRPEYDPWQAEVRVRFNAGMISPEQVYNLLTLAGMHCGICEGRPSSPESKTGSWGMWECLPDVTAEEK